MDVVYVVRHSDDNEQLRYSLRSIAANLAHDKVWVAGYTPSWVRGVRSVPVAPAFTKWQGSTLNLAAAVRERFLSRTFALLNDDFYVLSPVEDIPTFHRGAISDVLHEYGYTRSGYVTSMRNAERMLRAEGHREPLSYELHVPMVLQKANVRELLDDIPNHRLHPTSALALAAQKRTFYGNRYGVGGERIVDPKVYAATSKLPPGPFVSTCHASFGARAGKALRELFPEPCKYERS